MQSKILQIVWEWEVEIRERLNDKTKHRKNAVILQLFQKKKFIGPRQTCNPRVGGGGVDAGLRVLD